MASNFPVHFGFACLKRLIRLNPGNVLITPEEVEDLLSQATIGVHIL